MRYNDEVHRPTAVLPSFFLLGACALGVGVLSACAPDYALNAKAPDVDPADITDCGFTPVLDDGGGSTGFWSYDCNPVFTTTGEAWAPQIDNSAFLVTEVLGHPFYQLWYTGVDAANPEGWKLGYAVSAEGTDWIPSDANPLMSSMPDSWDASSMDAMQVAWDPDTSQYVLIYQGLSYTENNLDIGVLTSPDGLDWTALPQNPVYDLMQPAAGLDGWCWPLGLDLGPVAGFTGYLAGYDARANTCSAYELNASDLTSWTPSSQSVFVAGASGAWDDMGQVAIAIAALDHTEYLFYVGFGDWQASGNYQMSQHQFLGMATKNAEGKWDRRRDAIPINNTENGDIGTVAARTVGSRIHLWVTDEWDGAPGVGYFIYDPLGTMEESTP